MLENISIIINKWACYKSNKLIYFSWL